MGKVLHLCIVIIVLGAVIETSYGAANIIDIYKKIVFDVAVLKNPKPVIVFYYSSSKCASCKWSLKPMLEKMAKRRSNSLFLAFVDFDKVPELEAEHVIKVIPTTRVFYKGDVYDQYEGSSWAQLVPMINAAAKIYKRS